MPWRRNESGVQPRMCKQLCFPLSSSYSWTVHHATVSSHIICLRIGVMRKKKHIVSTSYGYNEFLSTPYKSCQGVESLNPGCMLKEVGCWAFWLWLGPPTRKGGQSHPTCSSMHSEVSGVLPKLGTQDQICFCAFQGCARKHTKCLSLF